ncbi:hypothetical protein GHT41_20820 [Citrobacter koseri]|uniref:fimbrial protein n=2 Tax=Citrobacter koseri TaxID=545 RepID=UPI0019047E11|nr:fimbrial protein [Citrobacter koseri]MBJ9356121.1 hypothetical protein [Citrobacter koseri]
MKHNNARKALMMTAFTMLMMCSVAEAREREVMHSSPVPVTFGMRALAPDTPVSSRIAFVSQVVSLPPVVCSACTEEDKWTRVWRLSDVTYDRDDSQRDQGWYVFRSGLKGIGVSIQVDPKSGRERQGTGRQADDEGELNVGLLRLSRETGAGLVDLPPAEFKRVTTFRGVDGEVKYVQEDTIRVSADMRVPTCTSTTGSLSFQLPDISQVWLRRNVVPGGYTDNQASLPQLVVANCSENTRTLRVRFIPSGSVTDSNEGPDTILVGKDENGQETGTGYLMKYDATAFGRSQAGVVQWNRNAPLVLENPQPTETGDALSEGISVTLRAYYARPLNDSAITAGQVTAKGLYQISYD